MKKLIVLLGVCIAVFAQAASIDWTVSATKSNRIYGVDGTTVFGKTTGDVAYLILADYADGVLAALQNGSFSADMAGVVGKSAGFNNFGGVSSSTATSDLMAENTAYDFVVLYLNGDASQYIMTGVQNSTTSDADTPRSITFKYSEILNVGWKSSSGVPEPTSGLLLLVGGAMLALRRKQK